MAVPWSVWGINSLGARLDYPSTTIFGISIGDHGDPGLKDSMDPAGTTPTLGIHQW